MQAQGYPYTAFMIFVRFLMPISFVLLVILLRLAQLFKVRPGNLLLSLSLYQTLGDASMFI